VSLKNNNWGYAYANGFVVLAEKCDMFIIGTVATGGKVNASGNLSFTKRTGWSCPRGIDSLKASATWSREKFWPL
jgi:hypothetical protein